MLIEWQDRYSVQNPVIDSQHKKLFSLANRLFKELRYGVSLAKTQIAFRELAEYAIYHCEEEERLLEKYNISSLASQRQEHELFKKKIGEFSLELCDDPQRAAARMIRFLSDWLTHHVIDADQNSFRELRAAGMPTEATP
jgi:hemerythrin